MFVVNIKRVLDPIMMNPMRLHLTTSFTHAWKKVATAILSQQALGGEWSTSGKRMVALPAEAG